MKYDDLISLSHKHSILLYDGVCILCNGYVKWLIKRDKKQLYRYVALQDIEDILSRLPSKDNDTVVLLQSGIQYTHSDVGLLITKSLGGLWPILSYLRILPKFFRDNIYRWIARNRYSWFGKQESCIIPESSISIAQCEFDSTDVSGLECTTAKFLCGFELHGYNGPLQPRFTPGIQPPNFCG